VIASQVKVETPSPSKVYASHTSSSQSLYSACNVKKVYTFQLQDVGLARASKFTNDTSVDQCDIFHINLETVTFVFSPWSTTRGIISSEDVASCIPHASTCNRKCQA
jgi:hypothetical protein